MQTLTHVWLALMIDISMKSLALAAVAGVALLALRARDTNLRHRVWTAVLLGMLVIPALVHVTPAIPLPHWMTVSMPVDSQPPIVAGDEAHVVAAPIAPAGAHDIAQVSYFNDSASGTFARPPAETAPLDAPNRPRFSARAAESRSGSIPTGNTSPESTTAAVTSANRLLLILAISYSIVAAIFACRLLVGLLLTRRLVGQTNVINSACLPLPRRRRVRLLESGRIQVPATVGFFRPVVLLPSCWREWSESKLQSVLAHELAHVRRADWVVITLAELNRAIYWFHPLAWFLRRRLAELAERNCDDAVLEAEGDRAQYARHLLEVAGLLASVDARNRAPLQGVAMARKPNVETRIDAILDPGRPLARRLGTLGAITLLVSGAIAVLLTAALRTAAEDAPKKPPAAMEMKGPAKPEAPKDDRTADKTAPADKRKHVKGRVLDPDGKPVAAASVYATWGLIPGGVESDRIVVKVVAQTKSDAQGRFELDFSTEPPEKVPLMNGWQIVAAAPGFGPAWLRDVHLLKGSPVERPPIFSLVKDVPIRGRVVDLEGNPLAGVRVGVQQVRFPESERAMLDWIQEAKEKKPPANLNDYFEPGSSSHSRKGSPYAGAFPALWNDGELTHGSPALPADTKTDYDGRFEFHQLGADRLAVLEFEGPSITKCRVHVVARDMETVSAQPLETLGVRTGTYYGRDFQFVAEPTQDIIGRVTDSETGQPLIDLEINLERIAGHVFQQKDFLATRTDKDGRYRILGAPRGGGHRVQVNSNLDQPYFPTDRELDKATGFAPVRETKTDADGQYRIELADASSKTHRDAHVMARADGTALAWRKLNLDAAAVEASFELKPEETISGRLVDIEGQAAAGVRFQVSSMRPRVITDQWPPDGVGLWRILSYKYIPLAWPQPIVTDAKGHFVIHGVPKDHGISLEVEGNDRFAPQDVSLNTGMAEQRGERDGTYRPLVKNFKPGEEAVLPLAPAQLFTGTVRFEDTGEPAPHARLTIWASQQKFGSMLSVTGKADENGRYKISPNPRIRFGVTAYPPDGTPYLARQQNDIPWEDGARSKVLDMKLPRGVLIRGKVLEEGSDAPIARASVQYHAEEANNPNHKDHILAGWQDIHLTDNEGHFQIVVVPGPGRLLIHAPQETYVLKETSGLELYKGRPGGQRNYAHAIERIDPAANATPPEIVIRLNRGATVRGELVNQQGAAVEANIFSRLRSDPLNLWWRGFPVEAKGGRFEVSGLAPDQEYPVYFLDSKRRLGATLTIKAGMGSPRVVLEPCGNAKMRFVDDAGKPVTSYEPTIEFVVTPGVLRYSQAAMNAGKLAADSDFIANIDRANHSLPEKADNDGRLTVSTLIPGATYRVVTYRNNEFVLSKEFKAVANETIDLGDITVERKEK